MGFLGGGGGLFSVCECVCVRVCVCVCVCVCVLGDMGFNVCVGEGVSTLLYVWSICKCSLQHCPSSHTTNRPH